MKNVSKSNGFYIFGDWGGSGSKGKSVKHATNIRMCWPNKYIWGSRIHNGFGEEHFIIS